jgi:hypothetical protein
MIHRVDRVNPDVDDRVIKPNEARMAVNLRFGASTDDTNLSGGTLILGNKQLPFTPPSPGVNKIVGVYTDLESRTIFFALFNSTGDHGIYRINGRNDQIDVVIGKDIFNNSYGGFLGFQDNDGYDVSMTYINGLLYWTDNVNPPYVINVERGIRTMNGASGDVYAQPGVNINYFQIKRPPGLPLDVCLVSPITLSAPAYIVSKYEYSMIQISVDISPELAIRQTVVKRAPFYNELGTQYSYYYEYDDNEVSKLGPWTKPIFFKTNVVLRVPDYERLNYLGAIDFGAVYKSYNVKKVVFVYRESEDGAPYLLAEVENNNNNFKSVRYLRGVGQASLAPSASSMNFNPNDKSINCVVIDQTSLNKTIIDLSIYAQKFDSVPLVSKTNTIAQNRINHANYILDRDNYNDIRLDLELEKITIPIGFDPYTVQNQPGTIYQDNLCLPGGVYEIGIELLDFAGRPIGVVSNKEVIIPNFIVSTIPYKRKFDNTLNQFKFQLAVGFNNIHNDFFSNLYKIKYTISGSLPYWAQFYRIVSTGAKNINYFHRTASPIFIYYEDQNGVRVPVVFDKMISDIDLNNAFKKFEPSIVGLNKNWVYKGFAIQKGSIPVNYSEEENLHIQFAEEYVPVTVYTDAHLNDPNYRPPMVTQYAAKEFKVVGERDGFFFLEVDDPSYLTTYLNTTNIPSDWKDKNPVTIFNALYYNILVYSKKTTQNSIFYQNSQVFNRDQYVSGQNNYVAGDCYLTYSTEDFSVKNRSFAIRVLGEPNKEFKYTYVQFNELKNIPLLMLSMNPRSRYATNWPKDVGQPAIVNTNQKEVRFENGIIFSSPIIERTQINGLNQFNSLDFRLAPVENGPITSLVVTNATQKEPGVMLAIGASGISSFYYDAIQLTNIDGSSNITTTDSYLASQRPLLGQYGTLRSMSITKTPLGTVYWWSDVVNDLIRYTNAGLERLGLTFSFSNYLRKKYNDNPYITTWYDQVTDEINLIGRDTFAATFSERYKTFQGERDFFEYGTVNTTPERAISLATKTYYFIQGRIFVSDVDDATIPNNFIFGSYKDPELNLVTNENPAIVKRWSQIKIFGNRPKLTRLSTPAEGYIPDPNTGIDASILVTSILPDYYINRKGDWEAAIRRAQNTNGGLMAGKLMESRIIYSKFAWNAEGFQKLNFIEVKSNISIVQ